MDDFSKSVMIALLPVGTGWCKIDLPHMTLVYAGEIDGLQPTDFNALAKDASSIAMMNQPFALQVTEVDVFGEEDKVDVLRFRSTPELEAMRHFVEKWNKSEFPFRPHATMGPIGTRTIVPYVPDQVTFDRVMVGWGDQRLTFLFRMVGAGL